MPSPFGRMKGVEVREFEFAFQPCGGKLELFGYYTPKGARSSDRYIGMGSHVVVLAGWGHPECESEIGMATRADGGAVGVAAHGVRRAKELEQQLERGKLPEITEQTRTALVDQRTT